jgi:hypothetical protein
VYHPSSASSGFGHRTKSPNLLRLVLAGAPPVPVKPGSTTASHQPWVNLPLAEAKAFRWRRHAALRGAWRGKALSEAGLLQEIIPGQQHVSVAWITTTKDNYSSSLFPGRYQQIPRRLPAPHQTPRGACAHAHVVRPPCETNAPADQHNRRCVSSIASEARAPSGECSRQGAC